MIKLANIAILALAKLKAKRLIMAFSVITSGILFALAFASLSLITGIQQSFDKFNYHAKQEIYSVGANPIIPTDVTRISSDALYYMGDNTSKSAYDEVMKQFGRYVQKQQQEAQELGIKFDTNSIAPPFLLWNNSGARSNTYILNEASPFYQYLLKNRQKAFASTATNNIDNLIKIAKEHGSAAVYPAQKTIFNYQNSNFIASQNEDYLSLGKEKNFAGSDPTKGETAVRNALITINNESPLEQFILPVNDKRQQQSDHIPILITAHEAQALFGQKYNIGPIPSDNQAKIDWINNLHSKVNGETFEICYRNEAEMARVKEFIKQNTISERKDADGNIIRETSQSAIIYKQPNGNCQPLEVAEDRRDQKTKQSDNNLIDFQKRKGIYIEPQVQRLKFQIVGTLPIRLGDGLQSQKPRNLQELAQSLFTNNYDSAIIPQKLYQQSNAKAIYNKLLDKLAANDSPLAIAGVEPSVVEFKSIADAKAFLEKDCPGDFGDVKRPACEFGFDLLPIGKNYLLYDTIQTNLFKIFTIFFAIIAVISGLILCLTMARVIVDSRRETAIFRALGAKRISIINIYTFYSLLIAVRIIVAAIFFAAIAVLVLQSIFAPQLTTLAKLSWNVFDQKLVFNLVGINFHWFSLMILSIVLITVAAILPPLLRNVRRNPIIDMRDE